MDILKRSKAPFADEAWYFLDEEATDVLNQKLKARSEVDFIGPKGLELSSINTGRFTDAGIQDVEGVSYATRDVLPLVELKIPFTMELSEIEALARGAEDVDTDALMEAASKIAQAENKAIFYGLEEVNIKGIIESSDYEEVSVSGGEKELISGLLKALSLFEENSVGGHKRLLLGPELYSLLYELDDKGYPLKRKVQEMASAGVVYVPDLANRGLLISERGGDFELTVGQDISLGFEERKGDKVELFFLETFTFRVNGPEAAVVLK
ncbi:family 1 encapsulin nanocompartment shell protein [Halanaerobium hydrogeniformans]|uniref:Type 1 encapsulin shell protein n=1 Tax=Halanaerobium hydrogeniformans TaxID=656519 RepID=E4RN20_HALHG|nr:family 1 encapsulin nanocompartment shell protein [Halanaerobium hydrogeniformans]ADQ14237.1 Linocin_M18 bacteriocin protein [Halanaerobium hydrogeniformans]